MTAPPTTGPSSEAIEAQGNMALNAWTIEITLVATITGVIAMQYATYLSSCKHDSRWLKGVAAMVALVSVGELVTDIKLLNQVILLGLTDHTALLHPPSSAAAQMAMTVSASILVQSYFAFIIYKLLSNSKIWLGVIGVLLLTELASGISGFVAMEIMTRTKSLTLKTLPSGWHFGLYITWLVLTAVIDTISSFVLCLNILRAQRSSPTKQTHDILGRMLVLTLETFSLTAVVSIVSLIVTLVPMSFSRDNPSLPTWHLTAAILSNNLLGRLYPISFFYSLNQRSSIHGDNSSSAREHQSSGSGRPRASQSGSQPIPIKVEVRKSTGPSSITDPVGEESTDIELQDRVRTLSQKGETVSFSV